MQNRIILCTIDLKPASSEKDVLKELGFDLDTLEEKGDTISILLPRHFLKVARAHETMGFPMDEIFYDNYDRRDRKRWKVLTISSFKNDVSFEIHYSAVSGAVKAMKLKQQSGMASPTIISSPSSSSLFTQSNLSEPSTPFTGVPDRSETSTPMPILSNTNDGDAAQTQDVEKEKKKEEVRSVTPAPY